MKGNGVPFRPNVERLFRENSDKDHRRLSHALTRIRNWTATVTKIQLGKDQEKAQSERDSHSKTEVGKNQTNNQALIP